jgi:anaerobic selenocysteine-containing dehydrogenase
LLEWIGRLDPAAERPDPDYPFSLVSGQRRSHNANQILRAPAWRKSDPDGALRIHPTDLADLGAGAGGWVAVVTATGRIVVRAEVDDSMRRGQVALPHGFGMSYPDGQGGRVTNGPRINQITATEDRDPIAGTPHHKDVHVRLEVASLEEAAAAEEASARVGELIGAAAAS